MSAWEGATIPQFRTQRKVDKAQCAQYAEATGESAQLGAYHVHVPPWKGLKTKSTRDCPRSCKPWTALEGIAKRKKRSLSAMVCLRPSSALTAAVRPCSF